MEYILMHKNIPVVDMEIDETGHISKLHTLHDSRRLPVGVPLLKTGACRGALIDWWMGRSIPASRDGINDALQIIGVSSSRYLIEKCYGLSLSDHYWICPKGSGLAWEDVNFFDNDFSKDMGEILFGHEPAILDRVSLMSPDNTSDGWLRKKWIVSDGKRVLMKGGSGVYQQEPFNEVIASAVMRRLGIDHIPYTLTFDGENPYCLCENFVTPDTELIPAWRILQTRKQPNNRSPRDHFTDCCEALGAPGSVDEALGKMLTLDYIIANEDRHWNNFGVIRDAETLQILSFAPVFDSGTSLWYNTPHIGRDMGAKPFRKKHSEQIKLVRDFSWFKFGALDGLAGEIMDILAPSDRVDEKRRLALAEAVAQRAEQIERLQLEHRPSLREHIRAADKERRERPPAPPREPKSRTGPEL